MTWAIHRGDVRQKLAELPALSQQVCVTSPPYHGLRAYNTEPQIWEAPCCDHNHEWGETLRLDRKHIWKEGAAGMQERARAAGAHERTNGQLCEHVHEWTEARPAGYRGSDTNPGALQHEGNKGRERLTSSVCAGGHVRQGIRGLVPCLSWRGELGLEPVADCWAWTRGEPPCARCYVCHMRTIFGGEERSEGVWRVLRDDGTLWLNLGDSYASHDPGGRRPGEFLNPGGRQSEGSEGVRNKAGSYRPPYLKPKDLQGVPWRVVMALQADGWYWRNVIAWCKKSAMPESVNDRPTNAWEPVLLLTKSGDALFWTHRDGKFPGTRTRPEPDYVWQDRENGDAEQVEEPEWPDQRMHTTACMKRFLHRDPKQEYGCGCRKRWRRLNLWSSHDYFYDKDAISESVAVEGRASGNKERKVRVPSRTNDHIGSSVPWEDDGSGRNMRNYIVAPDGVALNPWWLLGPEPSGEQHYAQWPTEIAKRAIKAGSSEKGVCPACGAPWARYAENFWMPTCRCDAGSPVPCSILDPFAGSGTTLLVADRLGRHGVGIELLDAYAKMAERRLASDAPLLDFEHADEPEPVQIELFG